MENNVTPIQFRNTSKKKRRPVQPATRFRGIDFPMLFTIVAICAFGVVMLFSASYYKAIVQFSGDGYYFVKRQLRYLLIGFSAMFITSIVPYKFYNNFKVIAALYGLMIALLLAAKFMGTTVLGAQRWIKIGSFSFQPSELVKFILIICLSFYMTRLKSKMSTFVWGILAVFVIILLPCVLILLQPNMSMLIIIILVTLLMLYIGGAPMGWLVGIGVVGAIGLLLLIKVAEYRNDRLIAWLDPWNNMRGKAYQVVQSLFAFANGGLTGQGLDASRQKLLFLPEMENDYILSIIAEELGFFWIVALLAAYAFIIYRGFKISMSVRDKDRFGSLVAAGISGALAIQVIVNVGVVTNALPATGQTLPFISAGGSSLMVFLGAFGILLNISRHTEKRKVPLFKNMFNKKRKAAEEAQ